MQINWAPEHCDALREYLAKGMSYAEAADAINARFDTAYSRNAAIGRAKRMGLAVPGPAEAALAEGRRNSSKPPRLRKTARAPRAESKRPMPPFRTAGARQTPLRPDRAAPSGADRAGSRRLPVSLWRRRGGRSHHLLRSSAARGLELLLGHFHLTRGPGTASERAAVPVALRLVEAA